MLLHFYLNCFILLVMIFGQINLGEIDHKKVSGNIDAFFDSSVDDLQDNFYDIPFIPDDKKNQVHSDTQNFEDDKNLINENDIFAFGREKLMRHQDQPKLEDKIVDNILNLDSDLAELHKLFLLKNRHIKRQIENNENIVSTTTNTARLYKNKPRIKRRIGGSFQELSRLNPSKHTILDSVVDEFNHIGKGRHNLHLRMQNIANDQAILENRHRKHFASQESSNLRDSSKNGNSEQEESCTSKNRIKKDIDEDIPLENGEKRHRYINSLYFAHKYRKGRTKTENIQTEKTDDLFDTLEKRYVKPPPKFHTKQRVSEPPFIHGTREGSIVELDNEKCETKFEDDDSNCSPDTKSKNNQTKYKDEATTKSSRNDKVKPQLHEKTPLFSKTHHKIDHPVDTEPPPKPAIKSVLSHIDSKSSTKQDNENELEEIEHEDYKAGDYIEFEKEHKNIDDKNVKKLQKKKHKLTKTSKKNSEFRMKRDQITNNNCENIIEEYIKYETTERQFAKNKIHIIQQPVAGIKNNKENAIDKYLKEETTKAKLLTYFGGGQADTIKSRNLPEIEDYFIRNKVERNYNTMEPQNIPDFDYDAAETDHRLENIDPGAAETDHRLENIDPGAAETDHRLENINHEAAETDHQLKNIDHEAAETDHKLEQIDHEAAGTDHQSDSLNLLENDSKNKDSDDKKAVDKINQFIEDQTTKQSIIRNSIEEIEDVPENIFLLKDSDKNLRFPENNYKNKQKVYIVEPNILENFQDRHKFDILKNYDNHKKRTAFLTPIFNKEKIHQIIQAKYHEKNFSRQNDELLGKNFPAESFSKVAKDFVPKTSSTKKTVTTRETTITNLGHKFSIERYTLPEFSLEKSSKKIEPITNEGIILPEFSTRTFLTQRNKLEKESTTEKCTTEMFVPLTFMPKVSLTEKSTTERSTTKRSTTKLSTTKRSTTKRSTTEKITTESSTTKKPTTESSTTKKPTTARSTPEKSTAEIFRKNSSSAKNLVNLKIIEIITVPEIARTQKYANEKFVRGDKESMCINTPQDPSPRFQGHKKFDQQVFLVSANKTQSNNNADQTDYDEQIPWAVSSRPKLKQRIYKVEPKINQKNSAQYSRNQKPGKLKKFSLSDEDFATENTEFNIYDVSEDENSRLQNQNRNLNNYLKHNRINDEESTENSNNDRKNNKVKLNKFKNSDISNQYFYKEIPENSKKNKLVEYTDNLDNIDDLSQEINKIHRHKTNKKGKKVYVAHTKNQGRRQHHRLYYEPENTYKKKAPSKIEQNRIINHEQVSMERFKKYLNLHPQEDFTEYLIKHGAPKKFNKRLKNKVNYEDDETDYTSDRETDDGETNENSKTNEFVHEKLNDENQAVNRELYNEIPVNNHEIQLNQNCDSADYANLDHCICSVKTMLRDLIDDIKDINSSVTYQYDCSKHIGIQPGIVIANDSKLLLVYRDKREIFFNNFLLRKGSRVGRDVDLLLNEDLNVAESEKFIYATVGSKVVISCGNESKYDTEDDKIVWTINNGAPETAGNKEDNGRELVIDRVTAQDTNNYTCSISHKMADDTFGPATKYIHRLSIVELPIYSLMITVILNETGKCEPTDLQTLHHYYPVLLNKLLCRGNEQICTVSIDKPKCTSKYSKNGVTLHATLKTVPLLSMLPTLKNKEKVCGINCQSRVYSIIVKILQKNFASVTNLPVFFRDNKHHKQFSPIQFEQGDKSNMFSNSILALCPQGFGVFAHNEKLCFSCEPHSYNPGNKKNCIPCPSGSYQPLYGSASCMTCSSPLDDARCLFGSKAEIAPKLYFIIPIILILLIIFVIIYCIWSSVRKSKIEANRDYIHNGGKYGQDIQTTVIDQVFSGVPSEKSYSKLQSEKLKLTNTNRKKSKPIPPPIDFQ